MIACASAWLAGTARGNGSRAVLVFTESAEPLYLFVLPHFRTQNRFTLLLEML
jgi:phosphatidylethanolamine/phosphatidyl-N-methylethanolamine N-methyltransferase